jgi:putative pyruvate formate lyase activating enzyme
MVAAFPALEIADREIGNRMGCLSTELSRPADQQFGSRSTVAAGRVPMARAALSHCHLCAHRCGVDRLHGPAGRCHADDRARVFLAQTELSDELELSPTFAIALSGCDLRCDFCITGRESWSSSSGKPIDVSDLAGAAEQALADGARSIMILGGEPTIHLPAVLELVSVLPNDSKLVWKTNGHGTDLARHLLEDLFDVWVVDYKFGNDQCAWQLARVPDYTAIVRENLIWAHERTELIVRHLLMPNHLDCCWRPVAAWLAREMEEVKVNLRTGFWPAWHSSRHAELRRGQNPQEADEARRHARRLGLNLVD